MKEQTICLFISGNLGLICLEQLYSKKHTRLISVFTDKKSIEIIKFSEENKIPCFCGNPRNGSTKEFISLYDRPDIVLSINYLFIIEEDLINLPKKYAINIHGSLLPRYRGRTPHVWSIINGENKTGITAHLITKKCDEGKIIKQIEIPITSSDTGGSILRKYNEIYPSMVEEILHEIENNNLSFKEQHESIATYFPKRTPEDGVIDFNWQIDRIINWVRAMCPPEYPGAFYYFENKKIIVSKAEYSALGFGENIINGTVLHEDKGYNIIKAANGSVKLTEWIDSNK